MPPRWGYRGRGACVSYGFLHRCRPYGTKEGFWRVQSLWLNPVQLETVPTGSGTTTVICSKIDTYGAIRKPHLPGWGCNIIRSIALFLGVLLCLRVVSACLMKDTYPFESVAFPARQLPNYFLNFIKPHLPYSVLSIN